MANRPRLLDLFRLLRHRPQRYPTLLENKRPLIKGAYHAAGIVPWRAESSRTEGWSQGANLTNRLTTHPPLTEASGHSLSTANTPAERRLRAFVYSFLICYAAGLLGAFGWGRHWNVYICLLLSLGSVVLWATFVKILVASDG